MTPLLIENSESANVTLDFSAVTTDLTFTIRENGSVIVTDSDGHGATFENVDNIKGGQGNNRYLIEKDGEISGYLDSSAGQALGKLQSLDYTEATKVEAVVSGSVTPVTDAVDYVLTTTPVVGKGIVELTSDGSYDYLVDPDKDFTDLVHSDPATTITVTLTYDAKDADGTTIGSGTIVLNVERNVDGKLIVNGTNEVQPVTGLSIDLSLDGATDATEAGQVDGFAGTVKGINLLVGTNKTDAFIAANGIETKLFGDASDDVLTGGDAEDVILAGAGMDLIDGGAEADTIEGQAGADHISGGDGADNIQGGDGNDYIDGGAGNDLIFGGAGNDIILGGAGSDSLVGDHGDDLYLFTGDWGQDVDTLEIISAKDSSGAAITIGSAIVLTHGSITIQSNGSYSYAPNAASSTHEIGQTFTETFLVTVENDAGFSEEISKTIALVNGEITVSIGEISVDTAALNLTLNGQLPLSDWLSDDAVVTGFGVGTTNLTPGLSTINFLNTGTLKINDDGSYFFVFSDATKLDTVGDVVSKTIKVAYAHSDDLTKTNTRTFELKFSATAGNGLVMAEGNNSSKNGDDLTTDVANGLTLGTNLSVRGVVEKAEGGDDTLSFAGMDAVIATDTNLAIDQVLAVTNDLTLTFNAGALNVADSAATANTVYIGSGSLENIELIKGGSGNNTYAFEDLWGGNTDTTVHLDDAATLNTKQGTLDFSNVSSDLVFTIENEVDDADVATGKVQVTVSSVQEVTYSKLIRIGLSNVTSGSEYIIADEDTTSIVYRTETQTITETVTHTVIATDIESLIGGSGNNRFVLVGEVSFSGDINGGTGTTTLDYSQFIKIVSSAQVGVTVDLTSLASTTDGITGNTSNIDNLIGTEFDDTLTGDANANVLEGRGGNDTLVGGAGNDTLDGGLGNDTPSRWC